MAGTASGVGGPGSDEGVPAGTVFLAVALRGRPAETRTRRFDGEPADVIEQAARVAVELALEGLVHRDRMAAGTDLTAEVADVEAG